MNKPKKKKENTKELENSKKIVKKKLNRKKHEESRAKTTLKRGFAYAFCLAGTELGLLLPGPAWLGLAWLSAVGFYILFWVKFMQMPKADRKRERGRGECGKWATNALRNFRTKSVRREREGGQGKHVKEQLLKRIYRFIYVFVCAM